MQNDYTSWIPNDAVVIHTHKYDVMSITGAQLIKFIEAHDLKNMTIVGKINAIAPDNNNERQTRIILEMVAAQSLYWE